MSEFVFRWQGQEAARLVISEGTAFLSGLCGILGGLGGQDSGPSAGRGWFRIDTDAGNVTAEDLRLLDHQGGDEEIRLTWKTDRPALRLESRWTLCPVTGIWSRRDTIQNAGGTDLVLRRCLSRFFFTPGQYELYSQESRWCHENQGTWQALTHGHVTLQCVHGRTTLGGTPYLFLRDRDHERGIAFHVRPMGHWTIRAACQPVGDNSLPLMVIETGFGQEDLRLPLGVGETLELPQVLIQAVPEGQPHAAAPRLHRYLLARHFQSSKTHAPVVYNTWFDDFDFLDVDRLRQQLAAAKAIGCEVLVIDAGWYGQGRGNWSEQTGDWREKLEGAFRGRMTDFASEVRSAGLGFGLWMEPERVDFTVDIARQHPDWFVRGPMAFYPKLQHRDAYDYILSEMSRLIETYQLAWMKIDFNNRLGIDPAGTEFHAYCQAWYRLLDELRAKYPTVFFEGCASGGLRSDIRTMEHCDGHFLSDTVNPIDTLRIGQGAMLRLVPGRWTQWAVMRSAGRGIPRYGTPVASAPHRVVTPSSAIWESSVILDLDFIVRATMIGMPGFSGDLAGLPSEARDRLREHITFYKKWRTFITGAIGHLLTPPELKENRNGWVAVQLQSPHDTTSLVFVYRLIDTRATNRFCLRGLDPAIHYQVINPDRAGGERRSGCELMNEGLTVELADMHRAAVLEIIPAGKEMP